MGGAPEGIKPPRIAIGAMAGPFRVADARSEVRHAEMAAASAGRMAEEAANELQEVKGELDETKAKLEEAELAVEKLKDEARRRMIGKG